MVTASEERTLIEQVAIGRARARTNVERWSPNVLVLAVSLLIVTNVLIHTKVSLVIVGAVTISGLIAVWVISWLQGKRLFKQAYHEELLKLQQEAVKLFASGKENQGEDFSRQPFRVNAHLYSKHEYSDN